MKQVYVDLIVAKITACGEQQRVPKKLVRMQVLSVDALLQTRIVLLDLVAVNRIIQVKSEIRIQVKQRPSQKSVHLEDVAGRHFFLVVGCKRSHPNAPTIIGIDISVSVQVSACHE